MSILDKLKDNSVKIDIDTAWDTKNDTISSHIINPNLSVSIWMIHFLKTIISILKKNQNERNEWDLEVLKPMLRQIEFFKKRNIEGQDLVDMCHELKYEVLNEGEYVFHNGDFGDKFYIIL